VNSVKLLNIGNRYHQDNTEPSFRGDAIEGVTVRGRSFGQQLIEGGNSSTSALDLKCFGLRLRDDLSRTVMCGGKDKKPCPTSMTLVTKLGFIWAPYVPLQMTKMTWSAAA
jgi:hypothetical protein